jgi:hypothetical protein
VNVAEVTTAINMDAVFLDECEDSSMALSSAEDAEVDSSGFAYIEVLRYAPCLVPFEERVRVCQDLISRDKAVSFHFFAMHVSIRGSGCCKHCIETLSMHGFAFRDFNCIFLA